jgi:hypothetical protein
MPLVLRHIEHPFLKTVVLALTADPIQTSLMATLQANLSASDTARASMPNFLALYLLSLSPARLGHVSGVVDVHSASTRAFAMAMRLSLEDASWTVAQDLAFDTGAAHNERITISTVLVRSRSAAITNFSTTVSSIVSLGKQYTDARTDIQGRLLHHTGHGASNICLSSHTHAQHFGQSANHHSSTIRIAPLGYRSRNRRQGQTGTTGSYVRASPTRAFLYRMVSHGSGFVGLAE